MCALVTGVQTSALPILPIVGLFVRRKVLAAMGLDKCRIALSGAADLSQELIGWFKSLGLEILEVYGMTENLAWSHSTPEGAQRIGWVGTPNDARSEERRVGKEFVRRCSSWR